MTLSSSLKLQTRTTQGLTARLRMAVRLLQMSSLDYERELHELAARNPFLDVDAATEGRPPATDAKAGLEAYGAISGPTDALAPAPGVVERDDDRGEGLERSSSSDRDDDLRDDADGAEPPEGGSSSAGDGPTRDGGHESAVAATDLVAAEIDLRAHLRDQARSLRLSPRDRALVHALIDSLDDDGLLRTPLDEIAALAGATPVPDEAEVATALRWVQSLEPSGVGARDLAECLRLQLDPEPAERHALCCTILAQHLERLARRDTAAIARATGRPAAEVEQACAAIRRLDPRPARRFDTRRVHYVVPDVVARKVQGRWEVRLNPAAVPQVRLNRSVCALFQGQRAGGGHRELAGHLQEARWAVRNIEQRFETILAVARSILKRQYGYFEHGPLAMKPLSLGEIADEVGVHESTVCRVTNNKYMATPAGVIELKTFFSRAMALESGGASSGVAIRELVRELIDDEGDAPLSDGDIARLLGRQGIRITRRTVTKYRGLLQLPAAEQRRRARCEADRGAAARQALASLPRADMA